MRILWMSDDPSAPTGFGNITSALCARLAQFGHEVFVFGGNKRKPPQRRRWVTVFPGDGRNPNERQLLRCLRRVQPDVLVTLIQPEEAACLRSAAFHRFRRATNLVWILYYPLDCDCHPAPLSSGMLKAIEQADLNVTLSRHARAFVRFSGLSSRYIPPGVDTEIFRPPEKKEHAKRALGYQNRFVILCDARNQIRKLLPRTMQIFQRFAAGKKNVLLHLHCDPFDPAARTAEYSYDILRDVELLGLDEKVRFTRAMSIHRGLNFSTLAALYQAADVHLLTSFGEGFGLPTLQALATGIVPLAPNYAAHRELLKDHGCLLKVQRFLRAEGGWRCAFVDVDDAVEHLDRLYRDRDLLTAKSKAAARFAQSFDWNLVVRKWHHLLTREVPAIRATKRRRAKKSFAQKSALIAKKHSLTIPVTLSPATSVDHTKRVTGRVCLASKADLKAFQKLRQVFPLLRAWSIAKIHSLGQPIPAASPRFCSQLATTTIALDLAGKQKSLPLLAANLGVPTLGLSSNPQQQWLWPELTLDQVDPTTAAQKARWILTDHIAVADACLLAKKRLRHSNSESPGGGEGS